MIEKLKRPVKIGGTTFREKINELIDVVNALIIENDIREKQVDRLQSTISKMEKVETPAENVQPDIESRPVNVQDKFAEQRKWIGKLCWFWDYKKENAVTGILSDLETTEPQPFVKYGLRYYVHCEPVKPDDDIIYQGE